jgi:hypothetical protein
VIFRQFVDTKDKVIAIGKEPAARKLASIGIISVLLHSGRTRRSAKVESYRVVDIIMATRGIIRGTGFCVWPHASSFAQIGDLLRRYTVALVFVSSTSERRFGLLTIHRCGKTSAG